MCTYHGVMMEVRGRLWNLLPLLPLYLGIELIPRNAKLSYQPNKTIKKKNKKTNQTIFNIRKITKI